MLGTIVALFLLIIVIGVAYWGANALLAAFNVGDPIKTVIVVAVVLFLLLLFLSQFGLGGGGSGCLSGGGHLHLLGG